MGDVLTKIADLLVTNLSGWSANWSAHSAENNDMNLVDLIIVW